MYFVMSGMHGAEMRNNLMLPSSLPPQLFIDGNDNSSFALIANSQINLYGNELMDAAAFGLGDYVFPQTLTAYSPPGTTSSSQVAIGLDKPCNLVSDFGIFHNSLRIQLPLVDTEMLTADDPKNVKRKRIAEEEESKLMVQNETILRGKRTRRRTPKSDSQSTESCIIEQSENCEKFCDTKAPAAKRSQKLGDKVTLLQKLVSPYGKTDTASVLQETEIYIKQLHEKILNMYKMLSCSHIRMNASAVLAPQEETFVLRRRGLRMMPLPECSTGSIFT